VSRPLPSPEEQAALLWRGLSGHHIAGLLPGRDPQPAIHAIVCGHGGWTGPEAGPWGQVGRRGIGLYADLRDAWDERNPLVMVRWTEVVAVLAAGCGDGRRAAYAAALDRFGAWVRAGQPHDPEGAVLDALHATTRAIIDAGCMAVAAPEQLGLF
jgi:hypothetical protein